MTRPGMVRLCLVPLLALAAPALADELPAPPLVSTPETPPPAPPPVEASPEAATVATPAPSPAVGDEGAPSAVTPGMRVARIGVGTAGGLVFGATAGAVVFLGSVSLMCGGGGCNSVGGVFAIVFGAMLGIAAAEAGVVTGAYLGGKLLGSKGAFGWTALGSAAGAGLGYLLAMVIASAARTTTEWQFAPMLLLAPLGGAIANELSSMRNEAELAESARALPAIAVVPGGAVASLSIRF